MDYLERYKQLNAEQKEAVDTIDGPLMVIAGPGTGKTELLSMRAANILRQTDSLPENILCLTFTDSAANAMRERLAQIIGSEAYKVSIQTFHGFGTETINQNSEFFFSGAFFRPVDELTTREIMTEIFDQLDYDSPIASKMNGKYIYLDEATRVIAELKKSGLADEELRLILDKNEAFIENIEPEISQLFDGRVSKQTLPGLVALRAKLDNLVEPVGIPAILSLAEVMADSLSRTIEEAEAHPKTTPPITAWKNDWLKKSADGKKQILKTTEAQKKLRALSYVYFKYLSLMREREFFDYDDMILEVVHAIETNPELRATLQEKYQYIMVDEFQDTNLAQMRILYNLTDNPVNEGRPNIMVVGDDDQAIYSFHGADVGNILHFKDSFRDVHVVTLHENYRSSSSILSFARDIILQGEVRLENELKDISKALNASSQQPDSPVALVEANSISSERSLVVNMIAEAIKDKEEPSEITVIARRHRELVALLPYFAKAGIAVNYERQDNVLDNELIQLIEGIARTALAIHDGRPDETDAYLRKIIGHPAFRFKAEAIWHLSLEAYKQRLGWLESMLASKDFNSFASWLVELGARLEHYPLEHMLDQIIGKSTAGDNSYQSPIFDYYFSDDKQVSNPSEYVFFLDALKTIRGKVSEHQPDTPPSLRGFIEFIDLSRQLGSEIRAIRPQADRQQGAVNLMTAHKAKGLEFNRVFILNGTDSSWGEKAATSHRNIRYPENLPIAAAGDNLDERLRLFFVAATRARRYLTISYSLADDKDKATLLASFVAGTKLEPLSVTANEPAESIAESEWYNRLTDVAPATMREILKPTLDNFRLSATHLNNFIDLVHCGPQQFLADTLLRFPQAPSSASAFGDAVHKTLQKAHEHYIKHGQLRPLEDSLSDFEGFLTNARLSKQEHERCLQRGLKALQTFFDKEASSFKPNQKTELDFKPQQVVVEGATLTGRLDLVDIDEKGRTITVTDYKTGRAANSWKGSSDTDKVRLHKYKQQLIFYKLLIENSRDYAKYDIIGEYLHFVEPDRAGEIIRLEANFSLEEVERLKQLIAAVWNKIINLDLPDASAYPANLAGIMKFEDDLIQGKI